MSNVYSVEELLAVVVAIPVCNEEQRIADCLGALAGQVGLSKGRFGILLFLNNCIDDTARLVAELLPAMPWPTRVVAVLDENATAGWARRRAMDDAAAWLKETGNDDGVILTSDADSRVGFDWVQRNLDHIAKGADVVAGRIALDASDAALLPASLHARGRLEARYEALLTEIGARLDPEPGNTWPCHWTASGATLAVRAKVYEAVGGMPALINGEDRAFTSAVRQAGFIVRHAIDIEVVTSGRLEGRAAGGCADTMRLRCEIPDSPCDERLERFDRALTRILWRRRLRRLHARGDLSLIRRWAPSVPVVEAIRIATMPSFTAAHAAFEASSLHFAYRPLRPSWLVWQIRAADLMVRLLRRLEQTASAIRRADSPPFGTDAVQPQIQPTLR